MQFDTNSSVGNKWQVWILNLALLVYVSVSPACIGKSAYHVQHTTYTAWHFTNQQAATRKLVNKNPVIVLKKANAVNQALPYKHSAETYSKIMQTKLLAANKTFQQLFPALVLARMKTIPGHLTYPSATLS